MPKSHSSVQAVKDQAKQTVTNAVANPWIERFARFGYAAKGMVYIIVGLLAIEVALGLGGKVTDSEGALQAIMIQPFGKVLLLGIAFGLVGYVLGCLVQAIVDPATQETDTQRVVQRLGYALSGLSYAGLAIAAAKMIIGLKSSKGNSSVDWTARLLSKPFGCWLVVLVGIVVIVVGFSYFYRAYTTEFLDQFDVLEMSKIELFWATHLGRFGMSARGSIFGVIGIYLIQAALRFDPEEAKGLGGALKAIAQQPFGLFLLGVIAVGLIAYGIYEIVLARYRRIVQI
ncbi:MAG: DUF1206 domain-containing protein [Microcoleus sp. SIO2G3]|nr:DUF1206 domain-containing protein [Microcoleus sp. SIO2G3]